MNATPLRCVNVAQTQALDGGDNRRADFRKVMLSLGRDMESLIIFWHRLVNSYSSINLTFKEDVLPAFS
jgi:hypothetical protein